MPSTSKSLIVEAPSRLHFGMFAFGAGHRRQFGGVGLMIREPRLRVVLRPSETFVCNGMYRDRVDRIARRVATRWLDGRLPPCTLTVEAAPREHVGLGLGTQLSLAAATALTRSSSVTESPSPVEIAVQLGRARRSSVGTYGFSGGGLIVDAGHARGEQIGPLVNRVELPEAWRVVLVIPREEGGLSGNREVEAFDNLQAVPRETTGRLTTEALLELLPAARDGDFAAFAESVDRFGREAGACFAVVQGGPYARSTAPLIERLREVGAAGVGQSSWGPSVFALAPDEDAARRLQSQLENEPLAAKAEIVVTKPDNRGAVVECSSA